MSRHDARALVGIARAGRAAGAAPQLRERKLARAPAEEIGRAWSGTAAGAGVGAAGPTCARVAGGAARTGSDGDARNQRVGWGHPTEKPFSTEKVEKSQLPARGGHVGRTR